MAASQTPLGTSSESTAKTAGGRPRLAKGKSEAELEAELISKSLRGDRSAYRDLVEKYQERVFALCFSLLRSKEDAEDITQETFVKAFLSLKNFEGASSFYTWVYRIAFNMVIDFKRKVKRKGGDAVELDESVKQGAGAEVLLSEPASPEQELERKELNERIGLALGELSESHRAVITLREVDGMSYEEIAEVTGVSRGTVMSRLHYARKRMQELLIDLYTHTALNGGDKDELETSTDKKTNQK